ncbi:MAG TPA: helix-turn-helix transcriptional regulator [Micromonosporaceae bacterium]
MRRDRADQARDKVDRLARSGLDWVSFARETTEVVAAAVPFDRCCWHTVDPGTVLLTGSVNWGVGCSGLWLAEHEYVVEDVNKWWFLARSGRRAGATSLATHGDLSRSARHRSQEAYGIGDELRGSFLADGNYWGAAGFLRDADRPWFTEDDVRFLASLSEPLAAGLRGALVKRAVSAELPVVPDGPGVVVFDQYGRPEFMSPAAEHLIAEIIEEPPRTSPGESPVVQSVAARVRAQGTGCDPLGLGARSRVQTRSGSWLLLYGTPLVGGDGRTAVIIQPAVGSEVAPLVALAYGLTERECQVVRLCMEGRSTRQMAAALGVSPYTAQDHLKSIFAKTGVRSRSELVGQIFLEHYLPRWDDLDDAPPGWTAKLTQPV